MLTALSGAAGAGRRRWPPSPGSGWHVELPELLPLAGLAFAVDALSGWFLLLVGAVTGRRRRLHGRLRRRDGHGAGVRGALARAAAVHRGDAARAGGGSVPTLLSCWELMAVTSLLLVLTEHRHRPAVRTRRRSGTRR